MSSLQPGKGSGKEQAGLRHPSNGKTIYHRPLNRTKTAELSQASFAYLFSEMISYAQRRVRGIQDLEARYIIPSLSPTPPAPSPKLTAILPPGSTPKATPSASSSSSSSSTAKPRAPSSGP